MVPMIRSLVLLIRGFDKRGWTPSVKSAFFYFLVDDDDNPLLESSFVIIFSRAVHKSRAVPYDEAVVWSGENASTGRLQYDVDV